VAGCRKLNERSDVVMYPRGGSTVTIAVPSGPSARNAMTPPLISPGTVVCSQGDAGIENVEVPKPASTGVSPVR
jgi:hypothetical protein